MKFNVEEMRAKVSSFYNWEHETKKSLFNETVRLIQDAVCNDELVLAKKPLGCYMSGGISAVKLGDSRGRKVIYYKTATRDYNDMSVIRQNGLAISGYIDLYEAVVASV